MSGGKSARYFKIIVMGHKVRVHLHHPYANKLCLPLGRWKKSAPPQWNVSTAPPQILLPILLPPLPIVRVVTRNIHRNQKSRIIPRYTSWHRKATKLLDYNSGKRTMETIMSVIPAANARALHVPPAVQKLGGLKREIHFVPKKCCCYLPTALNEDVGDIHKIVKVVSPAKVPLGERIVLVCIIPTTTSSTT